MNTRQYKLQPLHYSEAADKREVDIEVWGTFASHAIKSKLIRIIHCPETEVNEILKNFNLRSNVVVGPPHRPH